MKSLGLRRPWILLGFAWLLPWKGTRRYPPCPAPPPAEAACPGAVLCIYIYFLHIF